MSTKTRKIAALHKALNQWNDNPHSVDTVEAVKALTVTDSGRWWHGVKREIETPEDMAIFYRYAQDNPVFKDDAQKRHDFRLLKTQDFQIWWRTHPVQRQQMIKLFPTIKILVDQAKEERAAQVKAAQAKRETEERAAQVKRETEERAAQVKRETEERAAQEEAERRSKKSIELVSGPHNPLRDPDDAHRGYTNRMRSHDASYINEPSIGRQNVYIPVYHEEQQLVGYSGNDAISYSDVIPFAVIIFVIFSCLCVVIGCVISAGWFLFGRASAKNAENMKRKEEEHARIEITD
eukprot:1154416_1